MFYKFIYHYKVHILIVVGKNKIKEIIQEEIIMINEFGMEKYLKEIN